MNLQSTQSGLGIIQKSFTKPLDSTKLMWYSIYTTNEEVLRMQILAMVTIAITIGYLAYSEGKVQGYQEGFNDAREISKVFSTKSTGGDEY